MSRRYVLSAGDDSLRQKLELAAEEAVKIVERDMVRYESGDLYPAAWKDGKYEAVPNGDLRNNAWVDGFFPGQLWLCYELTGKEKFRALAEKNVVDFAKRMEDNLHIDWHHDTGFLYIPTCVSAYKLTGNKLAEKTALQAAYSLSRRFRTRGEFIQSMGFEIEPENYRFIIDTMMNIPLLFWAAEQTGEESYRIKAIKHAETTRKYIIREDGSTYHHFLMDFDTAGPKGGLTLQGAGNDSCWTRGQSWMVYGSALMYAHTGDESWIKTFETVTDYFLAHLPEDYIPHWDFAVLGTEDDDRDSSAGAICACGIMEMAANIGEKSGKMPQYIAAAKKMMAALAEHCAISFQSGREGLLDRVMGSKPHGSVEGCTPYGDYFYMESLVRALKEWNKYW